MHLRSSLAVKVLVLVIGLGSAGGSLTLLNEYEARPSALGVRTDWPAGAGIELSGSKPTLLVFAHPQCPCTRATFDELDRFVGHAGTKLNIEALFFSPSSEPKSWVETDTWRHAMRIPGVRAVRDVDGAEAKRFHAQTSGLAILYSSTGKELFRGGLTSSRGHEGPSAGVDLLDEFVRTGRLSAKSAPVYGCAIYG